jgi:L-malate glycosyltransferase
MRSATGNADRRPIALLHLHGSFERGGKEARAVRLMNIWGQRASHDILYATAGADEARVGIDAAVTAHVRHEPLLNGSPDPRRLLALARLMQGYDLVLTYNWGAMDAAMAHRLFHRILCLPPLVHHEDGFNADEAGGLMPSRNIFRRFGLQSAKSLAVPSCTLAHIAAEAWRQKADKVHHIPNGIDVGAYGRRPQADAIPGLTRARGRLVVGTLAGLRPVKNLPRLIRAVAPLGRKVQLVIVGEGEEKARLIETARECGLDDMLLPGFLPEPHRYIGLFDIFALSSDSEQFPISVVEAMAAGLPVLATDVGDVAQMVAPANRPFVVAPGNEAALAAGLATLVDDKILRTHIGQENRDKAHECFDEVGMVERYARLYGGAAGNEKALL